MKKINYLTLCVAAVVFSAVSCSSNVKRVNANTVIDLSGYWNDSDVRIVADTLVSECVAASAIATFEEKNGRPPIVIVGQFANNSDEHIDTSIIAKKFEISLVNSGKVEFVASSSERTFVREERDDQQINASESTASSVGNETGADYMLLGSVKTIVDSNGKQATRTYFVNAELVNIETNKKLWMGEDSSIKKLIKKSNVRM